MLSYLGAVSGKIWKSLQHTIQLFFYDKDEDEEIVLAFLFNEIITWLNLLHASNITNMKYEILQIGSGIDMGISVMQGTQN